MFGSNLGFGGSGANNHNPNNDFVCPDPPQDTISCIFLPSTQAFTELKSAL